MTGYKNISKFWLAMALLPVVQLSWVADSRAQAPPCNTSIVPATVHINRSSLSVTPHCKVIYGQLFLVEIDNPPGSGYTLNTGSVTISEKVVDPANPPAYTVSGVNNVDPSYAVATISGTIPADGVVKYTVTVAGHGEIDPRVEISDTIPSSIGDLFAKSVGLMDLDALLSALADDDKAD